MRGNVGTTLVQGLFAGLIGFFAVAGFFAVLNLVSGRPALYTASVLGAKLIGADPAVIDPGAALAFNGLHMVASVIIGICAAFLFYEMVQHPRGWYFFFFLFIAGFVVTSVMAGLLASELSYAAPWWAVIASNLLAASLAGTYLWSRHPELSEAAEEGSMGADAA